jgi:hypothetical protein
MKSNNPTAKQHFVPQLYLRAFADVGRNLRDLDVRTKRISRARPYQSFGYAHYYYALETGVPDDLSQDVERWLQQVESAVGRELDDLIAKILGNEPVEGRDRYVLSVLMAMLWLRSPQVRAQIDRLGEQVAEAMLRFRGRGAPAAALGERGAGLSADEKKQAAEIMSAGGDRLEFNNAHHLHLMTRSLGLDGPGFANVFQGHRWKVYVARGNCRFITTDSPVAEWCAPPEGPYGPTFLDREKYFALTPEILFELADPIPSEPAALARQTLLASDDDTVMMFNILLASRCQRSVYSGDRTILADMLAGLTNPGPPQRMFVDRFVRPWREAQLRRAPHTKERER